MSYTIDFHNKLIELSKKKKDGVYSKGGYKYLVKNNNLEFICSYGGEIYQVFGAFKTKIGGIEWQSDFKKVAKENKWL